MKSFIKQMGFNLKLLALGLVLALSFPTFAGKKGGGAGNGGGIGIRCLTDHVSLIERYSIDARNIQIDPNLSLEFGEFHRAIAVSLRAHSPVIASRYEELVASIGSVDTWEVRESEEGSKVQTFDAYLDFNLPEECSLVQMAVFPKGEKKPYLTLNWSPIFDRLDSRLIEAHEFLYHLGVESGLIDDPVLVRRILQNIVQADGSHLASNWIRTYIDPTASYSREYRGIYIGRFGVGEKDCPSAMMLDSTGDGIQVAFADFNRVTPYSGATTRIRQDSNGRWLPTSGGPALNRFEIITAEEVIFGGCSFINSNQDMSRGLLSEFLSLYSL